MAKLHAQSEHFNWHLPAPEIFKDPLFVPGFFCQCWRRCVLLQDNFPGLSDFICSYITWAGKPLVKGSTGLLWACGCCSPDTPGWGFPHWGKHMHFLGQLKWYLLDWHPRCISRQFHGQVDRCLQRGCFFSVLLRLNPHTLCFSWPVAPQLCGAHPQNWTFGQSKAQLSSMVTVGSHTGAFSQPFLSQRWALCYKRRSRGSGERGARPAFSPTSLQFLPPNLKT